MLKNPLGSLVSLLLYCCAPHRVKILVIKMNKEALKSWIQVHTTTQWLDPSHFAISSLAT